MSIPDDSNGDKAFPDMYIPTRAVGSFSTNTVSTYKYILYLATILCCSIGSFGLGILTERGGSRDTTKESLWIEKIPIQAITASVAGVLAPAKDSQESYVPIQEKLSVPKPAVIVVGGEVVASKTGSKYYLRSCSGVKRIAKENLITFSSAAEAKNRGYGPAKNCKGL
jgi:hypothetical protein